MLAAPGDRQMKTIHETILDSPVEGVNLRQGSLRDQLVDNATLLIFLRHFGWPFCRETVKDLRQVVDAVDDYPDILFFYQGNVGDGEEFFQRYWPEARAVSDRSRQYYAAFGLERAGLKQLFGPEVVACGLRAASNGTVGGKPVGDTRMMPGAFLVNEDQILWQHNYRHIGDHPDFAEISNLTGRHMKEQVS